MGVAHFYFYFCSFVFVTDGKPWDSRFKNIQLLLPEPNVLCYSVHMRILFYNSGLLIFDVQNILYILY